MHIICMSGYVHSIPCGLYVSGLNMKHCFYNSLCACFLLVLMLCSISYSQVDISATSSNSVYKIKSTFITEASSDTVFGVLSDYDNISKYVKSISSSKIKERGDEYIIIEQIAIVRILQLFKKRLYLLLKVREENTSIYFEDISKKDFKKYTGFWEFKEMDSGTAVTYSLLAKPNFIVLGFIVKKVLVDKGKSLCEEMLKEITRRTQ